MKTLRNINQEKEREKEKGSIEENQIPSRKGYRLSYEEIIFDIITEIPQYFDGEKFNDDSKLIDIKKRRPNEKIDRLREKNSKSLNKTKCLKGVMRRKSIINHNEEILKITTYSDDITKSEIEVENDKALIKYNDTLYPGFAILTDFRLKFYFDDFKNCDPLQLSKEFFQIPIFVINKLEKNVEKKVNDRYYLEISTKDNRTIKLIILNEDQKFYNLLNKFVYPGDDNQFFIFAFKYCGNQKKSHEVDGWKIYKLCDELKRMNVDYSNKKSRYRISKINNKFNFCSSYPKYLVVPGFFSDEDITECGNFRFKNRIPILSWQFAENKCCIWRSSQPKTGLSNQRSQADEKLLKMMIDYADKLLVYDARSQLSAYGNKLKGGGFEIAENYSKCEIKFCNLENIHTVRISFQKLNNLLNISKIKENKKFFSELEKTGWIDLISLIIETSIEITNSIKNGYTILIHCTDGWDRSSQISSISQLLIDPFYRTLEGFIILIEKEWLSFGHQFGYRNGNYAKELSEEQRSPIFILWLDCVHQIFIQFPTAFGFNMELLLFIASNFYSCLYGTFLFNSDKERSNFDSKNRTVSIWSYVVNPNNRKSFINPYYIPCKHIIPNYSIYKLRLWEEYYLGFYLSEVGIKTIDNKECLIFKNRHKLIEKTMLDDLLEIEKQKDHIKDLNNIIKDLSSVVNLYNQSDCLNENTKRFLEKLNQIQIAPQQVAINKIEVENKESKNILINIMENYL